MIRERNTTPGDILDRINEIMHVTTQMVAKQDEDHKRLIRLETRLSKTMTHLGLTPHGDRIVDQQK